MSVVKLRYNATDLLKYVDFLVQRQFGRLDHREEWHDEANNFGVGFISSNGSLYFDADVCCLLKELKLTFHGYRMVSNFDDVDLTVVAVF